MLQREFTEEQVMFRDAYRKFLAQEIVPHMEAWREAGIVDREAFRKAGEQGFLMVWPAEEYGGMGDPDFRFEQIIIEETAYARVGDWYNSLHSRLVGPYLTRFGNEEQCRRFLPKCASGECILAIAMTEPDAGSDLAGMRSNAVEKDDHWLLNGSKTFISNGINADLVVVAAKTDPDNNPHAMTLFLVERGMEGFERGRNLKKMGLKAQDTAELFFNDVKVPKAQRLGRARQGLYLPDAGACRRAPDRGRRLPVRRPGVLGPHRRLCERAQGLWQAAGGLPEHPVQARRDAHRAGPRPGLRRPVRALLQRRRT